MNGSGDGTHRDERNNPDKTTATALPSFLHLLLSTSGYQYPYHHPFNSRWQVAAFFNSYVRLPHPPTAIR
jgi:hypothetical protein